MSIEWAAGIFEGEGTIRTYKPKSGTYSVAVRMTDIDVLEKFQSIVGGSISLQQTCYSKPYHKTIWTWYICNKKGVRAFLTRVLPYLGLRRTYAAQNLLDDIDRK